MKRLLFFDKFLFLINIIFVILLFMGYAVPYIDPEINATIALFSLALPTLITINFIFMVVWIVKLKVHFLLSFVMLGLGYNHLQTFFSIHHQEKTTTPNLTFLSFNVRHFNSYNWIKSPTIKQDICNFVNNQNAAIICLQEYIDTKNVQIHINKVLEKRKNASGLAIFSKYKAINSGSLDFENTSNNAIYVDLKIDHQTVRIYNIHFQSFNLDTKKENYGVSNNKALLKRFQEVFKKQAKQVKILLNHVNASPYPTILAGDFNNTSFSWNYKQLTKNHNDAFVEAGTGFGKSYNYFLPFRIDFILPSKTMIVEDFTSFNVELSDHFPILAKINLNN